MHTVWHKTYRHLYAWEDKTFALQTALCRKERKIIALSEVTDRRLAVRPAGQSMYRICTNTRRRKAERRTFDEFRSRCHIYDRDRPRGVQAHSMDEQNTRALLISFGLAWFLGYSKHILIYFHVTWKPRLSSFKWGMVACSPPGNDWVPSQNVEATWFTPAQLWQKQ